MTSNTNPTAINEVSSVQAEGFSSMDGFLGANPAVKDMIEKSIRTGDVCSVNLSQLPLDASWDTAPAQQQTTSGAHKIK